MENQEENNIETIVYDSGFPLVVAKPGDPPMIDEPEEGVGLSQEYIDAANARFEEVMEKQKQQDALSVELNNATSMFSTLDRLRAQGTFTNYKRKK